jgi:DNA-binding transcriptional ArsR family regulator
MIAKPQKKNLVMELRLGKKASANLMALYHPLRNKLIVLIERRGKATISDLYKELHLPQAVASQHLAILRQAGIIIAQRDGKKIYYSINYNRITEITNSAHSLAGKNETDSGKNYLLNRPKIETVKEQIQKQWKEKGNKNHLAEIIGKWPGNETFEELSKMLTK